MKLCAETSTIKRVLLRADMLQKIRKYDTKLSYILHTFRVRFDLFSLRFCHANIPYFLQAQLTLDDGFAQMVGKQEVGTSTNTEQSISHLQEEDEAFVVDDASLNT